jgi:hypothetical protein
LEPLSAVLYALHKGNPNRGQWIVACLNGAWKKLVGEKLASVCRPARYENAHLLIEILDPDWDPAIKSVRHALQEKLRAATAGEVKTISFSR